VLDVERNTVVAGGNAHTRIDVEEFGRKLDALTEYETLDMEGE
jgi:hypothetical protein